MKRILLLIVGAALLFAVSSAFGSNTSITFVDSLSTYGDNYGNDRTGLYGAVINGQNTQMICDDYYHNISNNQQWSANGINAANLDSSNINSTQFGSTIGLVGYTELAWLANQMFVLKPSSDPTYTADLSLISQAMWYISSKGTAGTDNKWTNQAFAFYTGLNGANGLLQFANLWLYTPDDRSPSGPQEMWGVPEGGEPLVYLLLAGISCFGAMFYVRRQRAAAGMA